MNHRDLDHGQEVQSELFETSTNPSAFFEPADALLNDAATSVGFSIEFLWSSTAVDSRVVSPRDHAGDMVGSKPFADSGEIVAFVSRQTFRSLADSARRLRDGNLVHQGLDPCRVMDLTGGHLRGEGKALTVNHQVEFCAESSPGAAKTVVSRLLRIEDETFFEAPAAARAARTLDPSIEKRSHSILPSRSKRICRASR